MLTPAFVSEMFFKKSGVAGPVVFATESENFIALMPTAAS
jgi:hypothetical protein